MSIFCVCVFGEWFSIRFRSLHIRTNTSLFWTRSTYDPIISIALVLENCTISVFNSIKMVTKFTLKEITIRMDLHRLWNAYTHTETYSTFWIRVGSNNKLNRILSIYLTPSICFVCIDYEISHLIDINRSYYFDLIFFVFPLSFSVVVGLKQQCAPLIKIDAEWESERKNQKESERIDISDALCEWHSHISRIRKCKLEFKSTLRVYCI